MSSRCKSELIIMVIKISKLCFSYTLVSHLSVLAEAVLSKYVLGGE